MELINTLIALVTRGVEALESSAASNKQAVALSAQLLQAHRSGQHALPTDEAVQVVAEEEAPADVPAGPTAEQKAAKLEEKVKAKAAAEAAAKAEADAAAKAEAKAKAAATAKAPSVDDARAALKGYAAIEGNEAAMALLAKFDAKKRVALEEDKRAGFIAACK